MSVPRRVNLVRYTIAGVFAVGILYYLRFASQAAVIRSGMTQIPVTSGARLPESKVSSLVEPFPPVAEFELQHSEKPNIGQPTVVLSPPSNSNSVITTRHPIDELIEKAEREFDGVLKKESKGLKAAAAEYRSRRGRHPPPGFDIWFRFAKENNAVIIEDFWDQIYHDLGPFWGMPPAVMRREAWRGGMTINVRNRKAKASSDWFWTQIWLNMTQTIEHMLPDLDMSLNPMDEPRIVVSWEEIDGLMEVERSTRYMPPPEEMVDNFSTLGDVPDPEVEKKDQMFSDTRPFWKVAIRGCHPESPARQAAVLKEFNHVPEISLNYAIDHTYKGYVSNFTLSTDFCHQPDLQGLHGMMISPLSVSETEVFFPLFGGSKLPTNNEILLPAPMYWNNEERFTGGEDKGAPWTNKLDKVVWRGVATGGRNTADNWKGFQRHRFVAMTNGTKVSGAENWSEIPENWALPITQFNLSAQQEGRLGEWTSSWADTGFVDLMCDPAPEEGKPCPYTSPFFNVTEGMKMADQFDRKYLPDIDGNSFSGRYRGFLMSTSLPIKATIFREWHDSRLVPWIHFVPMDNRFMDFHGIMEYFLGYKGKKVNVPSHDEQAAKIAAAGQAWANKVLRKEDMQIYVLRLLLEYARLSNDGRNNMGYVGDLL